MKQLLLFLAIFLITRTYGYELGPTSRLSLKQMSVIRTLSVIDEERCNAFSCRTLVPLPIKHLETTKKSFWGNTFPYAQCLRSKIWSSEAILRYFCWGEFHKNPIIEQEIEVYKEARPKTPELKIIIPMGDRSSSNSSTSDCTTLSPLVSNQWEMNAPCDDESPHQSDKFPDLSQSIVMVDNLNEPVIYADNEFSPTIAGQWEEKSRTDLTRVFDIFAQNTYIHTHEQTYAGKNLSPSVRTFMTYKPHSAQTGPKKSKLVLLIHGTFAHDGKSFRKPDHIEFKNVLDSLKEMAEKDGSETHVISWGWSGHLEDKDREHSGRILAEFINTYGANYTSGVDVIAHSHGCNVATIAADNLKDGRTIENAIYLAAPVREELVYQPKRNIKNLYNFYSENDIIQKAGAATDVTSMIELASDTRKGRVFDTRSSDINIININTMSNVKTDSSGKNTQTFPSLESHNNIRLVTSGLHMILTKISEVFKDCHELNLYTKNDKKDKKVLSAFVTLNDKEDLHRVPKEKISKIVEYSNVALENLNGLVPD